MTKKNPSDRFMNIPMGIKERRTKILLALHLLSDDLSQSVNLNSDLQTIFDLKLGAKIKSVLNKLIEDNVVVVDNNTDQPLYQLSEKGFYELCLEFPFFRFIRDQWDNKWRILSYEIPESKRDLRDKLRREVSGWGLGPWHRSFWVTPHPIIDNLKELVAKKEEEQYIQAFESEHVFGDQKIMVEKVWNLSNLEAKYRILFKDWHSVLSKDTDKIAKLTQIVQLYTQILRIDPGLPKEILGENWIGFEAQNILKEIKSILLA